MKIAIASGKGGTGKTTLATNLASYLAENRKVVLTDLDVEEPNSAIFIKGRLIHKEDKFTMKPVWQKENCTLCSHCQDLCNFHAVIKIKEQIMVFPELCHSCYACSELCPTNSLPMIPHKMGELKQYEAGELVFIEGRLDIGQEQAVPLIAQTIHFVDQHFDGEYLKIFDSPPGTSCPVIEAVKDSDFVILVTEPTPFGLHDLKLTVENMLELNKSFGVVVNRHGLGNDDVFEYCRSQEIPILAKIPNQRGLAELYSKGKLIYPENQQVKQELAAIADFIDRLKPGEIL